MSRLRPLASEPAAGTQEDRVLRHLRTVGSLSGREATDLYRIRDLPKRVSVLRQLGHRIDGRMRRDALGQRYMRYSL
ncbi:MAG: helix-turn-helix domain-containing protein [Lysobacteraceae bacterium]